MSSIRKTPEHILAAYSLLATDTVAADTVAAAADTPAVGAEAADTAVEAVPEGAAAVEVAATAAATAAAVSGSDLSGSARGEGRSASVLRIAPGSPGGPKEPIERFYRKTHPNPDRGIGKRSPQRPGPSVCRSRNGQTRNFEQL
jgi:hypothetical protein